MEKLEGNLEVCFKLCFREGGQEAVVAASGQRKTATGRWKYRSEESFVKASDKPWGGMPLKEFQNATTRAGIH